MFGEPDNGATEIPGSTFDSTLVFLASPIRYWWTKNGDGQYYHDTPLYNVYSAWREKVRTDLIKEGFLTYCPHMAFKGPWNEELGNKINDFAVSKANMMVALDVVVDGKEIEAVGTAREVAIAKKIGMPVYYLYMHSTRKATSYQNLWEVL